MTTGYVNQGGYAIYLRNNAWMAQVVPHINMGSNIFVEILSSDR
jgi:hypothetical protein